MIATAVLARSFGRSSECNHESHIGKANEGVTDQGVEDEDRDESNEDRDEEAEAA